MDKRTLILVRGVPGCGKSTFKDYIKYDVHVEADKYFETYFEDKTYKETWDYFKEEGTLYNKHLYLAHKQCYELVEKSMQEDKTIVVTNTNIKQTDINKYYKIAKEYDYKVISLILENRHNGQDIHNVPKDVKQNMINNLSFQFHPYMNPTSIKEFENKIKHLKIKNKNTSKKVIRYSARKKDSYLIRKIKGFYWKHLKNKF